jgi:Fic family protein
MLTWKRELGQLLSARFNVRTTAAAMGYFGCPPAADMQRLAVLASKQWERFADPCERAVFAGVAIVLIHPLADGNGRLARMVWIQQLVAAGVSPFVALTIVQRIFSAQRDQFVGAIAEARGGRMQSIQSLFVH